MELPRVAPMTPRRDDAEALARRAAAQIADEDTATQVLGIKTTLSEQGIAEVIRRVIEPGLSAAYQRGQEEMRERAAKVGDAHSDDPGYEGGAAANVASEIRALPLVPESGRGHV